LAGYSDWSGFGRAKSARIHVEHTVVASVAPERKRKSVHLRPLAFTDRARIQQWMGDPDVVRFTVLVPSPDCAPAIPYGREAANRYLDTLIRDRSRRAWAVIADGVHVGNVGLKALSLGADTAECFIEIGDPAARGHGVARRAMDLLLEDAFDTLFLDEITLGVFEFNATAIALYRRIGFERAGHYGWHWADDRYWEVWKMRISRDRWVLEAALREAGLD
jgi:RimJ/RimL family protein N-acetyltransferase